MKKNTLRLTSLSLLCALACNIYAADNITLSGNDTQVISGENILDGQVKIEQGSKGQLATLLLEGNTYLETSSTLAALIGSSSANTSDGSALLEIKGDNNKVVFNGGLYTGAAASSFYGDGKVLISGSNNIIEAGLLIIGQGTSSGSSTLISVTGSNNQIWHSATWRDMIFFGRNGLETGGTNTLYLKGDGVAASQRVYFYGHNYKDTSGLKYNGSASNEVVNKTVLDGNVTFQSKTNRTLAGNIDTVYGAINVFMNSQGSDKITEKGVSIFEINSSGNDVLINKFYIGNDSQVNGSTASLSISGYGSNISVGELAVFGGAETDISSGTLSGGIMEFRFDGDKINTVEVENVLEFSGVLILDFSSVDLSSGNYEYKLICAESDWSGIGYDLIENRIIVRGNNLNGEWNLSMSDSGTDLILNYAVNIPEPSAYASTFGVLLFIIAVRRRLKK